MQNRPDFSERRANIGRIMYNTHNALSAKNYTRFSKNTLIGVFDLHMPSGLVLIGATHHNNNDKSWIGLPGAAYVDSGTGEVKWRKAIDFHDKETSRRFMNAALKAAEEARGHD